MPRTTAHRTAALAVASLGPLLPVLWAAGPAQAHGAPTDPASRVYACSPDGGSASRSAACRAAVRANGGQLGAWDNLRVANVNGRDRQTIPDGELCSGGLSAYKGLDLARADWPSTRVAPGGTLRMTYVSTIPHKGTFKLYLTKQGYDPAKPLTWADLPQRPFAEIKDPALTGGAYRFSAKLPADRTGRQVLYTVWQNSSTPDTYYSCSDVVFPGAETASPAAPTSAAPSTAPTPAASAPAAGGASGRPSASNPVSGVPSAAAAPARGSVGAGNPAAPAADTASTPVADATGAGSGPSTPLVAGGAAAALLLTGGVALVLRLRRR
ncbi:lytic polysaccharide monooxygenase [Streptomyces sp. NPDC002553]|uniref:lytic polysaccharide monooxygenase auxiliary activity family 9 protein n=1 Tax=unclassified Streptomyces TaxID=2593676 RepID=UPI00332AD07A